MGSLVIEDCVMSLLVVEFISKIKGYTVTIHVFEKGKYVTITFEDDLLTAQSNHFC